jgi:hypothetical protein
MRQTRGTKNKENDSLHRNISRKAHRDSLGHRIGLRWNTRAHFRHLPATPWMLIEARVTMYPSNFTRSKNQCDNWKDWNSSLN